MVKNTSIEPSVELNGYLYGSWYIPLDKKVKLGEIILRPGVTFDRLRSFSKPLDELIAKLVNPDEVVESVEIETK